MKGWRLAARAVRFGHRFGEYSVFDVPRADRSAVLGAADMVSVVVRMTLIQLETTDDMRGRVSAVNSLFVIGSNQLGDFRAGLMAAWLGTIPAVMVGGVGALIVVAIGSQLFRKRRIDTPTSRRSISKR